mgnify:CR=1 FL=1
MAQTLSAKDCRTLSHCDIETKTARSRPCKALAAAGLKAVVLEMRHNQIDGFAMARTRIMYVEDKSASLNGPARIGRVTFSKSGTSLSYAGRTFQRLKGGGASKSNYFDVETGAEFWISGPRKDGADRLYPGSSQPVAIDDDVAEEYWAVIRGLPPP